MVEINEIIEEGLTQAPYTSDWDTKRYVPKEGEPALPPQLSEFASKSTDEVMAELNRLPLFMTQLDETDGTESGNNVQVEALKALAYEGEPDEIATNFKNQGNEQYKAKQYKNAIEFYTKGLDVDCGVDEITASLYLNRAACNLELKNFRMCINDSKECLKIQPKNTKALFRSAKAFYAVERYDEAEQVLAYAVSIDDKNAAVNALVKQIAQRKKVLAEIAEKKRKVEEEKQRVKENLERAVALRGMTIIETSNSSSMVEGHQLHLEDKDDVESQLIFPATIIYPTTDEFDFVAETSELSTPLELMELVMDRPDSYFEETKHLNFRPKKLEAYMETKSGGLIKVGKKVAINTALMSQKPKVPLFDNALRIYFVPKAESADWIKSWKKESALEKRN